MMAEADLPALVGARICHDLISPLGAIGNGVELLELTGAPQSPEMRLIADSVTAAQARLKFFGIAYGPAAPGRLLERDDIAATLAAIAQGGRFSYAWDSAAEVPRALARAVFLLLQCLETAMPVGGAIRITLTPSACEVIAESARLALDDTLWSGPLSHASLSVTAAQVQFALLPAALADIGRRLTLTRHNGRLIARF